MKKILLAILISFAFPIFGIGQSITQLESKLNSLQQARTERKTELDSLTTVYEAHLQRIDQEKHRRKQDKKKIGQLMSEALTISDQLEIRKRNLADTENELQAVQEKLNEKYSYQIDSLQTLINSKNFKGDEERLQTRILQLSEKKLLVSSTVKRLSFAPEKILQIQPEQYTDSLEASIYTDYLANALAEVDSQLSRVQTSRKEYEDIIRLQEKTSEFLEEVSEDQHNGIFLAAENQTQLERQANSNPFSGGDLAVQEESIISAQFQSYQAILNQLNRSEQIQQQPFLDLPADSNYTNLTIKDYVQLQKKVEKELLSYKKIIQKKLGVH